MVAAQHRLNLLQVCNSRIAFGRHNAELLFQQIMHVDIGAATAAVGSCIRSVFVA
jgi:hypothetical protein